MRRRRRPDRLKLDRHRLVAVHHHRGVATAGELRAGNECIAKVTAQLCDLFGNEAANPTELFIMDWRAEALTSPPNVERLTNYQTYGHREFQTPTLNGRLHWASTETSPVAPGHIEGALAAAERAAGAIIENINADNTPGRTTT